MTGSENQLRSFDWGFSLRWLLATTVGLILGGIVGRAIGGDTLQWALTGASLGLAQWLILRSRIPGAGWWVLASTLGGTLGATLGLVGSTLTTTLLSRSGVSEAVKARWDLVGLSLGAWFGTFIGVMQWLQLRRHFSRSAWWIPVNTGAWGVTFVVGYAAGVAAGEPFGNTVGSITAGLIVGAATCVTLNFLLHRPLKSTVSGTSPSDSPLPPNRMSTIFKRIETQRDALRATHWASAGFYSLAAIHLALGLLDPLYLFSETCAAVLYGVFAGLLSTLKSRVVAWIALAFTALNVILTLAEMATQRRLCCWYLLIQVWASIRAVQGTSGWHKLSPPRTGSTLPAVVSIGRSVVAGCFGLIGVFWVLGATGYLTGKLVAPIKLSFSATVAVNTMLLVGGALNGLVAAAIYNLRSWGRYLAIAMCGCFLSGLIFMFLLHLQLPRELVIGDVIFAVVGTLTLVWVFLPSVKAAFRFNN